MKRNLISLWFLFSADKIAPQHTTFRQLHFECQQTEGESMVHEKHLLSDPEEPQNHTKTTNKEAPGDPWRPDFGFLRP